MIKLEAHRGVSKRFPENTMSAFEAAVNEGYDMIELDMCFSKDNRCLFLHDAAVNRTARRRNGGVIEEKMLAADMTYDELCELDFGLWKGEQFKGEHIPTLTEVLEFSGKNNIPLKFDNKLQIFSDEQQNLFFEEIERYGKLVGGFTASKIDFIKKIVGRFPECDIHYDGPVSRESLEEVSKNLVRNKLTTWLPVKKMSWLDYPPADEKQVELVKKYGDAGIWIVTEPEQFDRCIKLGADIVETDGTIVPSNRGVKNV